MLWLLPGVLFLLPFIDPRRPFRLLHLDLLVLAGFVALYVAGNFGEVAAATVADLGLLYLFGRMLTIGFRGRRVENKLLPIFPVRWLAVALLVIVCLRLAYPAIDTGQGLSDVGQASVIGADRITNGKGLLRQRTLGCRASQLQHVRTCALPRLHTFRAGLPVQSRL